VAVTGSGPSRKARWKAALGDRRLVGLVGATIALSLALSITPLSGRALPVLGWGVLVYLATAAVWAIRRPATFLGQPPPLQIRPAEGLGDDDLLRATGEALRRFNNPAALGRCALAGYLPLTLKKLADSDGAQTHASASQALRAALVLAIDRLKPGGGPDEQKLYYTILRDEYVLRHSTARIMTDYSISESTLHRYRRDAIQALASDLATQEEELAGAKT